MSASLVITVKTPDGIKLEDLQGATAATVCPDRNFVTPPLPFGDTYSALINAGPSYYVSAPVVIDAEHPLVACDI